ncbi:hypothetical protein ASD15_29935 [Massilia sp. Root351]|jgi:RimJ/RimL family protein N-acetyltransferase|uniref:GNAT family N-acetyltransferase n=1 Tax=Massilia sp. Root351 TaxID=1736522 RepID=UPI00070FD8BC|nr:GNAT family N-acetyltransferase [Massilia sp. Root351]KQV86290.1 hypothetical protein ASD15_29935 [Massilia sp. Root351]
MTDTSRFHIPAVLPALRGERLLLRAMKEDDAAALFDIYGDPQVMQYTGERPFPNPGTVRLMLKSVRKLLAEGESLEWAIASHDSGLVVGTCGLHSFDMALRTAEVGCLLRQSAWGKGYMAEALGLVTTFADEVLGLYGLAADVAEANVQAQRLFGKLGYRAAGSGMLELALKR